MLAWVYMGILGEGVRGFIFLFLFFFLSSPTYLSPPLWEDFMYNLHEVERDVIEEGHMEPQCCNFPGKE